MNSSTQANAAFAISEQERKQLVRLAYRFCWNPSDAEDALHNAVLNATQKADQLREPDKRWSWLCRIVIQQCHLLGRQERRRSAKQLAEVEAPRSATAALDQKELGELMRRLLVHLPEKQRVALTLKHLERMEYPQIAQIMNVSQSTVRAHVRAGREALRQLIMARHPEWQT